GESVSASTGTSLWSISKATTFPARLASCSVSEPIPGPTSMTPVFSWISALSSTSLMTFRSVRKFCPRLFLNEKPWSSSICFVLPAVAISFILLPRQFFQYIRYTCFVDIIPVQLRPQLPGICVSDVQTVTQMPSPDCSFRCTGQSPACHIPDCDCLFCHHHVRVDL